MILIGQFDSPFVRRAGIALTLYGIVFDHWPWSTFGDADRLRAYNPLTRVPTLVLDDGEVVIETLAILDHVDSLVPEKRRLIAASGADRRRALKICTLAGGLSDKAVSLFYEQRLHDHESELWVGRCTRQISGALGALETHRAASAAPFIFGDAIGHADIAIAAALRHLLDTQPGLAAMTGYPALAAHLQRCEALPVFQTIYQPFKPPA